MDEESLAKWEHIFKTKPALSTLSAPEREGYLIKQGGFPKNWKRRWFVLKEDFLYYFQDKDGGAPVKGCILLKGAEVSTLGMYAKKNYCFQVTSAISRRPGKSDDDSRTFYIGAENGADMNQWVEAIKAAAERAGGGGGAGEGDTVPISTGISKADFDIVSVIGKGSFGKVMLVRHKVDGKFYAMKSLRKDAIIKRKQVEHTKSERNILQIIAHPFIVSLRYAFQTDDKLYLILDYCAGGELFFHLKNEGKFAEDRARLYAAEITSALDHLHRMDVIYRDLKPENILLDADGHIRLTDFGLSKEDVTSNTAATTFCGTPEYLAPEMLTGQGHGKGVDWWSLGTLLYEMLTGLPPFYSQNINVMYEKILKDKLYFPPYLSNDAKSLLQGLLTREVNQRLGSSNPDEVKNHPFFASIDWDALNRRTINPSWKPEVKDDPTDLSNFDEEFTSAAAEDSPVEGSELKDADQDMFEGFTFVGKSALRG